MGRSTSAGKISRVSWWVSFPALWDSTSPQCLETTLKTPTCSVSFTHTVWHILYLHMFKYITLYILLYYFMFILKTHTFIYLSINDRSIVLNQTWIRYPVFYSPAGSWDPTASEEQTRAWSDHQVSLQKTQINTCKSTTVSAVLMLWALSYLRLILLSGDRVVSTSQTTSSGSSTPDPWGEGKWILIMSLLWVSTFISHRSLLFIKLIRIITA